VIGAHEPLEMAEKGLNEAADRGSGHLLPKLRRPVQAARCSMPNQLSIGTLSNNFLSGSSMRLSWLH